MASSGRYSNRYTNLHLLYIQTGYTNHEQIKSALQQTLHKVQKELKYKIHTRFRINVVTKDNSKTMGYAYLWVTNPEFYHILLGNNPDGSSRIKIINDPDWQEGSQSDIDRIKETMQTTTNWADIDDLSQQLDSLTNRPTIEIKLPPIVVLPRIFYTDEQYQNILQDNYLNIYLNNDSIPPKFIDITIEQGYINNVRNGYTPYILQCCNTPEWITIKMLKQIFIPYVTNPNTEVIRRICGKRVKGTYPLVHINNNRKAFITFDSNTQDASFALAMCMKLPLVNNTTKEISTLRFYYVKKHN